MSTSPFAASFEALEPRLAPAGIITATFANGVLTLTGDAADNGISINQSPEQDAFYFGSNDGTVFRLNGADPEGALALYTPVKTVNIDLKGGSDSVQISDLHLTGGLTINLGSGDNNRVDASFLAVDGGLKISAGDGGDVLSLVGITVGGSTSIALGKGDNYTTLIATSPIPQPFALGKGISYTGGSGIDQVAILGEQLSIGGSVNINTGSGDDQAGLGGGSSLTIAGGVSIIMGAHVGEAFVGISSSHMDIGGSLAVRNGSGPMAMSVGDAGAMLHIGGSLSLTNNVGSDGGSFALRGQSMVIGGSLSLALGGGSSMTFIEGGSSGPLTGSLAIGGNFTLSHGNGIGSADSISLADLAVGGKFGLTSGTGLISHVINVNSLHAGGGISVTHTAAVDPSGANQPTSTEIIAQDLITPSITITNGNGLFINTVRSDNGLVTGGISIRNGNASPDGQTFDTLEGNWDIGGSLEFNGGSGGIATLLISHDLIHIAKDLKSTSTNTGAIGGGFETTGGALRVGGDITVRHGNGLFGTALASGSLTVGDDIGIFIGNAAPDQTNYASIAVARGFDCGGDITIRAGAGEFAFSLAGGTVDILGGISVANGAYHAGDIGMNMYSMVAQDLTVNGPILLNNSSGGPSGTEISAQVMHLGSGLTLLNGAGNDTFSLHGVTLDIAGNIALRNGAGATETHIRAEGGALTLHGGLIVTSLAGDDVLDLQGPGTLSGGLVTSFGAGDAITVTLGGSSSTLHPHLAIGGPVTINGGASALRNIQFVYTTVLGALNVTGGSSSDILTLDNSTFLGPVSASLLGGDDVIYAEYSTFHGAFTFSGGEGSDGLVIGQFFANSTQPTQFLGPVNVRLGAGDDSLFIFETYTPAIFHSRVLFDGGAGVNTLDANITPTPTGNQPVFLAGLPTVSHFEIP